MGTTIETRVDDLEHGGDDGERGIGIFQTIFVDATEPDYLERASDAAVGDKRAPGFRSMKAAVKWIEREYPEIPEEAYNHIQSIVGHRTRPGAQFNIVDMCPKYGPKETARRLQERIEHLAEHEASLERQRRETAEELAERRKPYSPKLD